MSNASNGSPVKNGGFYDYDNRSDDSGTPSPSKSPSKMGKSVVFRDVPDTDKETQRMVNGTPMPPRKLEPQQQQQQQPQQKDEVMTVDTISNTYTIQSQPVTSSNSYPLVPVTERELVPQTGIVPTTATTTAVIQENHIPYTTPSNPLPPIGGYSTRLSQSKSYIVSAGPQQIASTSSNLPAILQNSVEKLQMNFIQNKPISSVTTATLEEDDDGAQEPRRQIVVGNGGVTHSKTNNGGTDYYNNSTTVVSKNGIPNGGSKISKENGGAGGGGVVKVSVYGEVSFTNGNGKHHQ